MTHVRPKKSLGQHFLTDDNIARKIAALTRPAEGETILEIGPGAGALTRFLLEQGAPVRAVETDPEAAGVLAARLPDPRLEIVRDDFLRYAPPPARYVFAGNLPYNISSPIMFRVLELRADVRRAVFMVQKEVAQRLTAPHGSKTYGILSVLLAVYFHTKYEFSVPPTVFYPRPNVDSAVLSLERRAEPLADETLSPFASLKMLVKTAFNHRRKMLGNTLGPICPDLPPEFARLRPEQLAPADFVRISVKCRP